MTPDILFITGIDTDAGKTYATAFLAELFAKQGRKVITQKFIQTGCKDCSEDILKHRELAGVPLTDEDRDGTTAPIIFSYPASAQLAARIDGKEIDLSLVDEATSKLLNKYDTVLIEGAGGLMVPLTDTMFTIDYITGRKLPVVLVTNGRLGSINHTILSLEALESRKIDIFAVIYNTWFDSDPVIAADTKGFIRRYLQRRHPSAVYLEMPCNKNIEQ